MEYISVNEAAARWGVHVRIVQNYCNKGRIPGAQKFGRSWMLPSNTDKPGDPRRFITATPTKEQSADFPRKNPLLNFSSLYHTPGSGDAVRASLASLPDAQALFAAQLAYSRGDIATACAAAERLLVANSCFEMRIGVGLLLSLCAMYLGDLVLWNRAKLHIAETPCHNQNERERLTFWLAAADSAIYDNAGFSEHFCRGSFDFLPVDSFAAARFFYAKYLYVAFNNAVQERIQSKEQRRYDALLEMLPAICELLISQCSAEGALLAELYLRLLCAISYHNKGENDLATEQINRAISLALPDRLFSPLAEYCRPLDLLLEERLGAIDRIALRKVKAQSKQLNEGWTKLHNTILNRQVSNRLTTREREIARYAVYGLSNGEIAKRLCISVATVKQSLRSVMDKTGAENRLALAQFI